MKIDFEINRDGVRFTDSIQIPDGAALSELEIDAMKESRFQAHLELLRAMLAGEFE